MSIRRRLIVLTVAAMALAVATATPKAAGPIGGCPRGGAWELVLVAAVFPDVDPSVLAGIPSLDGNGDGWTCIRPAGPSVSFRDNTVQGPPD